MTDPTPATASLSLPAPSSAEALREWAWSHDLREQLDRNKIPPRYRFMDPEWPEPRQLAMVEQTEAKLNGSGAIVAWIGNRGLGKTHAACAIVIRRLWNRWEFANTHPCNPDSYGTPYPYMPYKKLSDLVSYYKPLYSDYGTVQADELEGARRALCGASLLIIDEIAEFEESRVRQRLVADILDRRYAARKDTLLLANFTEAAFRASVGESVYSRIGEHGAIMHPSWESFRIQ